MVCLAQVEVGQDFHYHRATISGRRDLGRCICRNAVGSCSGKVVCVGQVNVSSCDHLVSIKLGSCPQRSLVGSSVTCHPSGSLLHAICRWAAHLPTVMTHSSANGQFVLRFSFVDLAQLEHRRPPPAASPSRALRRHAEPGGRRLAPGVGGVDPVVLGRGRPPPRARRLRRPPTPFFSACPRAGAGPSVPSFILCVCDPLPHKKNIGPASGPPEGV